MRASPSTAVAEHDSARARPCAPPASSTARKASAGRAISLNSVEAKAGSPGFGDLFPGSERPGHRLGQLEPIARDDRLRVRERGRIGHCRSRSDHRRIVARRVGDRERQEPGRLRAARQPPALDAGESFRTVFISPMLAPERRAPVSPPACRQSSSPRPARSSPPMRRPKDRHQHQIVGRRRVGDLQGLLRAGKPRRVGHRMSRLDHPDPAGSGGHSRAA